MKNKTLKIDHFDNNKLNSKVGRILTQEQFTDFIPKTPNKIRGLIA
jgi:hypothetical protein